MKIVITGNMGYVGPAVVNQLRIAFPRAILAGFDMGYFASHLTNATVLPESKLDAQYFGDVRNFDSQILLNADVVVHLAAISNDPMGSRFEEVTLDVNHQASINIAKMAKASGVRSFVFASSCSIYGAGDDRDKLETSELNPLTAYARSKVHTERDLMPLADENFTVTCLRFATACGMSDRLRLDLVLNDFVASAVAVGKVQILSNGSPWRPLIHVKDMARAIEWAVGRKASEGGTFLAVNTGSNQWNYQVKELAQAVAKAIPGTEVSLNDAAPPDKRSYRVNFDLFKSLAPHYQPVYDLDQTINELREALLSMQFTNKDFRNSSFMRMQILSLLQESGNINDRLEWTHQTWKTSTLTMTA